MYYCFAKSKIIVCIVAWGAKNGWKGGGEGCFFTFCCVFFSALFQQFVVHLQRGVFFLFGAVAGFCVAADAAVALAGVGVGAGAVPFELAATAHYHLDGYAGEGKGQKHYGQCGY